MKGNRPGAKKNSISDKDLNISLKALSNNLNTVNLGGGLYKVRYPKIGQGKSGGYRTIIVYKKNDKAIFVFGFAKSEKDNLDKDELKYLKKLSKNLLQIKNEDYMILIKNRSFFNVEGNI